MGESQTFYLCSLLMALAGLGTVGVIHGLGYQEWGTEWKLFEHDLEQNWERVELQILVPEWMFCTWMTLYAIQVFWVFYGFVALAKETKGGWLAAHPPILPSSVFITFLFGLACTIGFVVVWDLREHNTFSIIPAGGASVFYLLSLGISAYAVKRHGNDLRSQGFSCDVTFIQVFLHNGVAAMTAWLPCVTAYVMAVILAAEDLLERDAAQYVALGIISAYYVAFALVDVIGFTDVTRYVITPYLTYIYAYVMVIYENYGDGSDFNTFFKVGLGLTCAGAFLALVKLFRSLACSVHEAPAEEAFEGGAVQYQEPEYYYDKEHDSSQTGLVHY